ncbi:MAG: HlyD family type I secretion periplasmic adaptor subunit [Gammaproteobacteria bacterium]|nr:HlyD family type I secretion periplasmic adaptor subunit [Gammaproteobacteria bacterium]
MKTERSLFAYQVFGYALLAVLVLGFGGWAVFASISGAIIATGQVAVESNTKTLQHLEGGIVSDILISEGDPVYQGQLLMRLDGTETQSRLSIVRGRIDELLAKQARLRAERDGLDEIEFPFEIAYRSVEESVENILSGQKRLFASRQATLVGQKAQLKEKITQLDKEILGLEAQLQAKEAQASLIASELEDLLGLREQGLVSEGRVLALKREAAKIGGERGQHVAQIARIKGQISETRLQIIQLEQEARTEVLNEITDVEAQLTELTEKRVAAEEQLRRIEIRAPHSGQIHQMMVHTIGGVIGPGQQLLQIVPQDDRLVVEARLEPRDIDQIRVRQAAVARFSAFDQRSTPEIKGFVKRIAADLSQDPVTGQQYYAVRIEFDEKEKTRLGKNELVPGMPADIFIATGARTPISYLLQPLTDQIARAFRES